MDTYEKKYKEAMEKFKNFKDKYCTGGDLGFGDIIFDKSGKAQEEFDNIFPELKESKDEKIRKEIIDYIKTGTYKKDWIIWLEKQSEEARNIALRTEYEKGRTDAIAEMQKPVWSEKDEGIRNFLISKMEEVGNVWKEYSAKDIIAWLEKQGEQKPAKNIVETWKDMRLEVYQQASGNRHEPNCSDDTTKMFSLNDIDEITEKMNEQNPTNDTDKDIVIADKDTSILNKVEPRFHEGEWITNGNFTWKIVEVKPLDYILQSQDGNIVDDTISYVDEHFHSFTIEDAKDGDVLITNEKQPFIFNGHYDEDTDYIYAYCGISDLVKDDSFYCEKEGIEEEFNVWCTNENIYPATKEQRSLLFKKMKEAGYEWDAEKKSLKKIEQKPVSITDEWIEDYWQHEKVNNPYSYDKGDEIQFDHQGFVRFCKKYCKNPVEWSEEDNRKIKFLVNLVNEWCDKAPNATSMVKEEMSDWLKSLKDRYTWKPSDEQMKQLGWIAEQNKDNMIGKELMTLYNDLKKLKE